MYERHFGLSRAPFSIAPDPRYLFMSERHREALAHLLFGVRAGGGFVVLTGEIGAGKTTICRSFLEQIPERCEVAYIFNPKLTVEELLASVCAEFRVPCAHEGDGKTTVKDYVDALNEYLLRTHAVARNNVLIIDEAQSLSADVLEQLRLLTNLETNETKLLQIVLIGQPELRAMLATPGLEQLAQRVIARYHLNALGEVETGNYIRHRLAVAGLAGPLPFDRNVMRRIYRYSRGVPRRINLLCDRALLGAYAKGRDRVDLRTVDEAAREVLDRADFAGIRRARYERAALLGSGLAAGAILAGALTYLLDPVARPDDSTDEAIAATAPSAQASAATVVATPPATALATPAAPAQAPDTSDAQGPSPVTASAAAAATAAAPFDLPTGFATLVGAEDDAWRELLSAWKLAPVSGDPCQAARRQQIHCYRNANMTLALIRQLNRPGILTLRDGRNRPAHVMLSGLSSDHATLRIGGVPRTVSLFALADYWRGEFSTFWRVPPGYSDPISGDQRGPGAHWLARQLAIARGDTGPLSARIDDAALKASIHSFQLAQGLLSDGIAGPITLMRLNRVIGVDEPRLEREN